VGAGHAGSEAAAAAANLGSKNALGYYESAKNIAQMSCNPAMGGIAKDRSFVRLMRLVVFWNCF
jgi:tRNA uridine 5-carboxymethylaminomethyl modification enzyme